MKETLRAIAAESAPGSALLLEYLNRGGLDLLRKYPTGMIKNAFDWGEPFVFGVPDGTGPGVLPGIGLELGEALKKSAARIGQALRHPPGWELLRHTPGEGVQSSGTKPP